MKTTPRSEKTARAVLREHTLIVPYIKTKAIRTLRNSSADNGPAGLFIRAKAHPYIEGMWFTYVSDTGEVETQYERDHGIVVFVPRALRVGEAVLVEKVFMHGMAAKGHPVPLPHDYVCPAELVVSNLTA